MNIKQSHEKMWKFIQEQLSELSKDKYCEDINEIDLLCAIIVQAGMDQDKDFIKSDQFSTYCYALRLDERHIRALILKAWEIQAANELWNPLPQVSEDY
jgi:hypothetical protein